jgi:hypothetical protein
VFPISLAVWCVLGLVLAAPLPLGATTLSLSPTRDNTLYSGGDLSNGVGEQLFVGVNGQGRRQRALVHFDLAGSPPDDALIESASLQVAVTLTMAGAFDVNAHRLLADWGEGTGVLLSLGLIGLAVCGHRPSSE